MPSASPFGFGGARPVVAINFCEKRERPRPQRRAARLMLWMWTQTPSLFPYEPFHVVDTAFPPCPSTLRLAAHRCGGYGVDWPGGKAVILENKIVHFGGKK
jgi:hypothetical protein